MDEKAFMEEIRPLPLARQASLLLGGAAPFPRFLARSHWYNDLGRASGSGRSATECGITFKVTEWEEGGRFWARIFVPLDGGWAALGPRSYVTRAARAGAIVSRTQRLGRLFFPVEMRKIKSLF